MDHALSLRGVTKRFGSFTAVSDLSLEVPKGCIYGFLGQNGAGKTTTIRMVMSIFHPDAGTISVLGHPDAAEVKDRLGYLPEEKGLYKKMKTAEIVAYFGKLKGMDRTTANEKARELLTRYGLGDWLDKKCEAMSKGMGQKVQVLGSIIHEPELVILDEPFSGLDPVNRDTMRDIILDMKRQGRTVIFSTHGMEQAEQLCDYVMMIHKGRLQFAGTLSDVKKGRDLGIQLDYDGDGRVLQQLPGAQRVNDNGKHAEIYLHQGGDPQQALRWLVDRVTVKRFDYSEPSLHEIFIRTVDEANRRLEAAGAGR
ncbi:MAG TPA: ATP-binding cassette domain-containing protein [Planctomycetota bacterium]|nr:ATP-binding cassette domain-containing protein [Planctomycetota bacterium]